jgi:RES domain
MTGTDDTYICASCIGNRRFANWIRANGSMGRCDLDPDNHTRARKVVKVKDFAEYVDEWFREAYTKGEEEGYVTADSDNIHYRQRGEPYDEILMYELECSEDVVRAVAEELPDATHREIQKGADQFYDSGASYESIAAIEERRRQEQEEYWFENRFTFQWREFCEGVQYERRFFKLKEPLDELFGSPKEYESGTIRPVYTIAAGERLYRARLLDDGFTKEQLNQNPARELGAPPRDKTRAGRMNVEYIPAFYAAFSEETAVAEIRPGIGEQVAVGEFEVQKELRVFDFTAFSRAKDDEWNAAYEHTRYHFIKQMEDEISKPILPFEKQREYIPTQMVAEYLREYFDCDAVVYRSAMIRDHKKETRNIVVLNKGVPFVGAGAALAFRTHRVKEVSNVTYDLIEYPF